MKSSSRFFVRLLAIAALLVVHVAPVRAALALCNTQSTEATKSLYAFIGSVSGRRVISGQMDDSYLQYIKDNTGGKEPALMGYDLNGVDTGTNGDAAKAIKWVKERGGIAQFNWHWVSPDRKGDYYYKGFNLTAALADTSSANYKAIIRDLDLAATELKKLSDAGVPVIWRPLHEAEGGWFWWGMSGGDSLKALYRLMYTRFTNQWGLHNLIWTWTSYGIDKGQNWYPGDDVVDMIVYDYPNYGPYGSWNMYNAMFGAKGKLFAIGEDGKIVDPSLIATQKWTFFMTWAYMIKDPATDSSGKNSKAWLNQTYNDPRLITLADLAVESPYTYAVAPTIATGSGSQFYNISTRGTVGALSSQYMIAGFVIDGTSDQTVLIRATGPGLTAFGISDFVADPYFEVYDHLGVLVGGNDNHSVTLNEIAAGAGAFAQPDGSADAAGVYTLKPGNYTVQVKTRAGVGQAIVEVYQLD